MKWLTVKRKKYFDCFVWGAITPGLGHLRAGAIKSGIALITLNIVAKLIYRLDILNVDSLGVYIMFGAWILVMIFAAVHPVLIAKEKATPSNLPNKYGKMPIVFSLFLVSKLILTYSPRNIDYYGVTSSNMAPTLLVGENFLVKGIKDKSNLKRGDIIVYWDSKGGKTKVISRIVGLPGDSVEVYNHNLIINDEEVTYEELENSNQTEI